MENKRKSSVAADIAVIKEKKDGKNKQLLMIKRGGKTFHGYLAFPVSLIIHIFILCRYRTIFKNMKFDF